ncbi:MAG: class I SAM-dependent methyltransferase [Moraxellaceae bacterium]|nr:class I SAM-dependent methyltransferase [Moraxellaceae bacterium]
MSLYSRHVFPHLLEWIMTQPSFLAARAELLATVEGDALEIGFGTGINLEYYPDTVDNLTTVDVNPGVQKLARKRLAQSRLPVKFALISGESLPMADNSYDAVISTWTLCSIPDVKSALREIRRVLKPEGRFYFVEHGLHPDPAIQKWQHRLTPVQKVIADGCHLDRDTLKLIAEAGMSLDNYRQFEAEGLPKVGAFMTLGVARK